MLTEKNWTLYFTVQETWLSCTHFPKIKSVVTSSSSLDLFFLCTSNNSLYLLPLFPLIPMVFSFEISWRLFLGSGNNNNNNNIKKKTKTKNRNPTQVSTKRNIIGWFHSNIQRQSGFHPVQSCLAKFLCGPFSCILADFPSDHKVASWRSNRLCMIPLSHLGKKK